MIFAMQSEMLTMHVVQSLWWKSAEIKLVVHFAMIKDQCAFLNVLITIMYLLLDLGKMSETTGNEYQCLC